MKKKLQLPVHPGEILEEEFLKPLGITKYRLAKELHVPAQRIGDIVNGKRAITAETALRLARYFKTTADFWLGLQMHYELQCAEDVNEKQINKEIKPRDLLDKADKAA